MHTHRPPHPSDAYGVMSDDALEALRQRNAQRAQQAIHQLGQRWVLHRAHQPERSANAAPTGSAQRALHLPASAA